ncbi:MAG: Ldh family oxidoreductase [bacterium]
METVELEIHKLKDFIMSIFRQFGVTDDDAFITADVLISADRRGIPSHGVVRLLRYIEDLEEKRTSPIYSPTIIKETPISILINANRSLGQVCAYRAMEKALGLAEKSGFGIVIVKNSSHFGIAGFYSMMALTRDMIGISMSNSTPLVVPTFSKDALLGTNPLSIAFPAKKYKAMVIDMATNTVSRGKVEVYARQGKKMPLTWAVDSNGFPIDNPSIVLKNLKERLGGGLLTLGGAGEENSGHKGFCLTLAIEVLTGLLAGSAFSDNIGRSKDRNDISFLLAAIRIDLFRNPDDFKNDIDYLIDKLKSSNKSNGESVIYFPGEKEFINENKHSKTVEITIDIYNIISNIGKKYGLVI